MELNDNYYTESSTEVDEDYALRYTPFANLPLNSQFDVSGAFGMCGGAFPLCVIRALFTAATFTNAIYQSRMPHSLITVT